MSSTRTLNSTVNILLCSVSQINFKKKHSSCFFVALLNLSFCWQFRLSTYCRDACWHTWKFKFNKTNNLYLFIRACVPFLPSVSWWATRRVLASWKRKAKLMSYLPCHFTNTKQLSYSVQLVFCVNLWKKKCWTSLVNLPRALMRKHRGYMVKNTWQCTFSVKSVVNSTWKSMHFLITTLLTTTWLPVQLLACITSE